MAGDRRATEGHAIAHRAMQKVFPADRWSAVAIAGAAGPAVEMVRLFQVQLEHYEKVEGVTLSLEGKANQLAQMVREHLPMAMQGLAVVPLFAGYDRRRETRADLHLRRHRRSLRGDRLPGHRLGRSRRPDHHQAGLAGGPLAERGRGPRHHGPLRGRRRGLRHRRAGPRPWHLPAGRRRRLPRATGRSPGYRGRRAVLVPRRAPTPRRGRQHRGRGGWRGDDDALLRGARAGHEGPGRVRPEGHRTRPLPRRLRTTATAS